MGEALDMNNPNSDSGELGRAIWLGETTRSLHLKHKETTKPSRHIILYLNYQTMA